MAKAVSIKRQSETELAVQWDDGHVSLFTFQLLRDECPCANCKGEVILGKVYRPISLPVFTPGMYELVSLTPTGQYGVTAKWKDGHDTGIYSWEYLRAICPCEACSAERAALEKALEEEQKKQGLS